MTSIRTESFAYDGGREVSIWMPNTPPEAIVYAGDGASIAQWGADLESASLPPTMIVGIHAIDSDDEMDRIREYSPGFAPDTFAAHEQFVMRDVRGWVKTELGIDLPPERTAICGASASGELALALGLRHPDVFGNVFCMSPGGGYQPPDNLPEKLPRFYFTAGLQEPWFAENARRWATALKSAGAEVLITEREGDHGDPFWQQEFVSMVKWMLAD